MGLSSKRRSWNLLRWLIYLIDLVVDNLRKCFKLTTKTVEKSTTELTMCMVNQRFDFEQPITSTTLSALNRVIKLEK